MFKLIYHYSACVSIVTDDCKVLCDPWFTDGAYDGSWYQFPKLENPINRLGKSDVIYVSHIHPDHYDPKFLREYLSVYPETKIIIADFKPNYLKNKMEADGFKPQIVDEMDFNETKLKIIPNELNPYDIDSALIVKHHEKNVVNMNDNLFNPNLVSKVLEFTGGEVTLACMGYTGAGPYPQTYYSDPEILLKKAQEKKLAFFHRFHEMAQALKPKHILPFAGKYVLGGKHTWMNPYRGVADATEVLELNAKSFVLDDGGEAYFDLETEQPSKVRTTKYPQAQLTERLSEIQAGRYQYDEDFSSLQLKDIPFQRLLRSAYKNGMQKSLMESDYFMLIKFSSDLCVCMNLNKSAPEITFGELDKFKTKSPQSLLEIDYRHLFGLLTMFYHWNNAEVGSHYLVTRTPDIFNRDAQAFFNHFHV